MIEFPERDVPLETGGLFYSPLMQQFRTVPNHMEPHFRAFALRLMKELHRKGWQFILCAQTDCSFILVHPTHGLMISLKQWETIFAIAKEIARKRKFKGLKCMPHEPFKFYV